MPRKFFLGALISSNENTYLDKNCQPSGGLSGWALKELYFLGDGRFCRDFLHGGNVERLRAAPVERCFRCFDAERMAMIQG
ncbi:MAG: hypothetical protein ACOY5C_13890 [Pseudomonadota bacterium]